MLTTDPQFRQRFRSKALSEIKVRGGLIAYRQAQISLERPDCRDIFGVAHDHEFEPVPKNAPRVAAQWLRETDPDAIWSPQL